MGVFDSNFQNSLRWPGDIYRGDWDEYVREGLLDGVEIGAGEVVLEFLFSNSLVHSVRVPAGSAVGTYSVSVRVKCRGRRYYRYSQMLVLSMRVIFLSGSGRKVNGAVTDFDSDLHGSFDINSPGWEVECRDLFERLAMLRPPKLVSNPCFTIEL